MATNKWVLDPAHSEIHFKIRHLVISTITGSFNIFSGTLFTQNHDDFTDAAFDITIDVYSINTNNRERDEHLKSADFFDADKFPEITFKSSRFVHRDGDNYELIGNLTVKDVTREVVLNVLFGGEAKDGFGINRAGFEIIGNINRNEFNIHAPDVTETGGLVLGEDIKLLASVQFINKVE